MWCLNSHLKITVTNHIKRIKHQPIVRKPQQWLLIRNIKCCLPNDHHQSDTSTSIVESYHAVTSINETWKLSYSRR
ncbi:hypothetical protein AB6A40_005727 [Gnathostoma spinigerum]|uniref:Uncharacterized protein n=1 Tax=Gnathostoma spinigerum TaxID=75299 RepID=A0ABD6EPT7_9BILA